MSDVPKILIVDDEPMVRITLEALLAAEDVELLFAEDGMQGVSMAKEHLPDAILMDVMMPGIDGYEACRQIRARPELAEVPIIMVTALDDREARLEGLNAGADDFLTKPFDGLEIQIRLKNIMRINRYRNLMAERARFLWVVENDSHGYVQIAENGEIVYANPRAQEYLHLPEDYSHINFVRQAGRYYRLHETKDGIDGIEPDLGVSYLVQPETDVAPAFWLRVQMLQSPLNLAHQQLLRLSDVTDEMAAQQDMRKMRLLVAHKLRTPIAIMHTSMMLLDRHMDDMPLEEVRTLVRSVWTNVERLVDSVRDMLQYLDAPLSLTEGRPTLVGDLPRMITNTAETLEMRDVLVTVPTVLAEQQLKLSSAAMELVVYELLENSKKFHPQHTPHVQVRIEEHPHGLLLQFLDDGQLMTARQIEQAKQPFSQSEKWFTGEVPGMGVGLPLVNALLWQTGGQMRIANREDKVGICVSLVAPVLS